MGVWEHFCGVGVGGGWWGIMLGSWAGRVDEYFGWVRVSEDEWGGLGIGEGEWVGWAQCNYTSLCLITRSRNVSYKVETYLHFHRMHMAIKLGRMLVT